VDLGDTYLVEFLTEKGKALSQNEFLKEASEGDVARAKKLEEEASKRMNLPVHSRWNRNEIGADVGAIPSGQDP